MKKALLLGLSISMLPVQAGLLESIGGALNLSPTQTNNLGASISSILSGSRNTVSVQEDLNLGECIDLVAQAQKEQINSKEELINTGYSTHTIYSAMLDGQYSQFFERGDNSFGLSLKRGLSDYNSIRLNSTVGSQTHPQIDSRCSLYMDIERVSIISLNDTKCRKVEMTIGGIENETNNEIRYNFANFFCAGETNIKTSFLERDDNEIREIKEK